MPPDPEKRLGSHSAREAKAESKGGISATWDLTGPGKLQIERPATTS